MVELMAFNKRFYTERHQLLRERSGDGSSPCLPNQPPVRGTSRPRTTCQRKDLERSA